MKKKTIALAAAGLLTVGGIGGNLTPSVFHGTKAKASDESHTAEIKGTQDAIQRIAQHEKEHVEVANQKAKAAEESKNNVVQKDAATLAASKDVNQQLKDLLNQNGVKIPSNLENANFSIAQPQPISAPVVAPLFHEIEQAESKLGTLEKSTAKPQQTAISAPAKSTGNDDAAANVAALEAQIEALRGELNRQYVEAKYLNGWANEIAMTYANY